MNKPDRLTSAERAALRAQRLRPKEVWVPDIRDPEVRRRIHEACQRIAASPKREEEIALAEALQHRPADDPD